MISTRTDCVEGEDIHCAETKESKGADFGTPVHQGGYDDEQR